MLHQLISKKAADRVKAKFESRLRESEKYLMPCHRTWAKLRGQKRRAFAAALEGMRERPAPQ